MREKFRIIEILQVAKRNMSITEIKNSLSTATKKFFLNSDLIGKDANKSFGKFELSDLDLTLFFENNKHIFTLNENLVSLKPSVNLITFNAEFSKSEQLADLIFVKAFDDCCYKSSAEVKSLAKHFAKEYLDESSFSLSTNPVPPTPATNTAPPTPATNTAPTTPATNAAPTTPATNAALPTLDASASPPTPATNTAPPTPATNAALPTLDASAAPPNLEAKVEVSREVMRERLPNINWRSSCFCDIDCKEIISWKKHKRGVTDCRILFDDTAKSLDWTNVIDIMVEHATRSAQHKLEGADDIRVFLEQIADDTCFFISREDIAEKFRVIRQEKGFGHNSDPTPTQISDHILVSLCAGAVLSKIENGEMLKLITAFRQLVTHPIKADSEDAYTLRKRDAAKKVIYSELKLMDNPLQFRCPFSYLDGHKCPLDSSYVLTQKLQPGSAFLAHICLCHASTKVISPTDIQKDIKNKIAALVGNCIEAYLRYFLRIRSNLLDKSGLLEIFHKNCKEIENLLVCVDTGLPGASLTECHTSNADASPMAPATDEIALDEGDEILDIGLHKSLLESYRDKEIKTAKPGPPSSKFLRYMSKVGLRDDSVNSKDESTMSLKGTDRYTGWSLEELRAYDQLAIDPKAYPAIMPRKDAVAGHRIYDVDHVWEVQLFEKAILLTQRYSDPGLSLHDNATLFETLNSEANLNVTFWKINSVKKTLFTKFLSFYVYKSDLGDYDKCPSFAEILALDIREVDSKRTMNRKTVHYEFERLLAEEKSPSWQEVCYIQSKSVLENLELHMLEILCGPFYRILVEGEDGEEDKPSEALKTFYCVLVDMYLTMFPLTLTRRRTPSEDA